MSAQKRRAHVTRYSLIVLAILTSLSAVAGAQSGAIATTVARWNASDLACRTTATPAREAIAACEERDRFSKLLTLMNQCYRPVGPAKAATWTACDSGKPSDAASSTAQFHRRAGVFVLPVILNATAQTFFVVDSGASHVQVPQEVVDELMRQGTLDSSDFVGERGFVVADGRKLVQKTMRLRSVRIGNRTLENVLAAVGPRHSQALLGQSLLKRLNWWKIDNVKNAIELEFVGPL